MNKIKLSVTTLLLAVAGTAFAGGILTNTNQSVLFLKNPARGAAIGLDGVYSNPAGVVFMPEGFHLAINWQYAHQTRTITSTNPLFLLGKKNSNAVKTFEGIADAPFIPSIQAAMNKGNWSLQLNFSMPGGGGVCEFGNGLGSFESAVGMIAKQLEPLGARGYDVDAYMRGRQYYFGLQVGAAYKVTPNLSVYGGLRALYGDASYKARLSNIQVKTESGTYVDFASFLNNATENLNKQVWQTELAIANGLITPEQAAQGLERAHHALTQLETLQKYSQGVNLMSIQTGFGIAPIIGVDWKVGDFNFAAKYEFNTQMKMKNHSTLEKVTEIEAMNKFQDGTEVDEDAPALLTVGAQWTVTQGVNLNLGYHHYFDTDAHWYEHSEKKLGGGTNEYLAGVEWDINDKVNVSAGCQLTRYQLTDEYMNDMSFVVNSYSYGFGMTYKFNKTVKASVAYFQTNYENYDRVTKANPETGATILGDSFTRTNRVLGLGVEISI
ncbi:MAG: transporter [Prevotella sp.]|uniref:OmpP1/FadL family transporter n=1 Tax=Prevotella sp. TaxID=59823 RepID=UPI002A324159|nr:transporter [Prevotella sp.]MDD7317363.1 transporter [Prevotellaceae bacterium]MDY4019461.1 transporter [Prevotella sp.]